MALVRSLRLCSAPLVSRAASLLPDSSSDANKADSTSNVPARSFFGYGGKHTSQSKVLGEVSAQIFELQGQTVIAAQILVKHAQ